jgi:hypothetical protein
MARQLTPREKRMLLLGAICAVAIPSFTYGGKWLDDWSRVRASLATSKMRLDDIRSAEMKRAGLLSVVPVFEPPEDEVAQKLLLRDKLHEQLKKAGIKTEPLTFFDARTSTKVGYRVLKVKVRGKCKFEQLLDFLAATKENPYLVGIEELDIQCDSKEPPEKRKDVEISMTVSTFVQSANDEKERGSAASANERD